MKKYLANFDYEAFLFDPHYQENSKKNISVIKELEYVFFLVNKEESLFINYNQYSEDYLNYLKSLNFYIPKFSPKTEPFENWWGKKDNLPLERILNSKLTSAKIAKEKNWGFHEGEVVNSIVELNLYVDQSDRQHFILKSPFSFSGIGHTFFNRDELNKLPHLKFPLLLEPVYERICDFGFTYQQRNGVHENTFIVLNFNNDKGSFKGGVGFKNISLFVDYVEENFKFKITDQILEEYFKIINIYKELGATENIQIDSFLYNDNDEIKIYQLVEVNYRKTMGLLIDSLCHHFEQDRIEVKITHRDHYDTEVGYQKISPENTKFKMYYKYL